MFEWFNVRKHTYGSKENLMDMLPVTLMQCLLWYRYITKALTGNIGVMFAMLQIYYQGKQQYRDEPDMEETHILLQKQRDVAKEETKVMITDLLPKTVYSFSISAMFLDATTWGPPYRLEIETWPDSKDLSLLECIVRQTWYH